MSHAENHVNGCMVPAFAAAEVAADRALKHTATLIVETLAMQRGMEKDHNTHGNAFSAMKEELADAANHLAMARSAIARAHKDGEEICAAGDPPIIVQGGGGGGK